ncbi:MAG: hypothetical protein IKU28_03770 [Erysipelotrichaceae bacterium]|nr:hypothetical protein [Erysipelotrichaceae bacterium]
MTRRSTSKPNIAMCAAFVLLCLTLISTHFTSGLYARYVTKDSAEDAARVIKFGNLTLTESGDFATGQAILVPGKDLKKDVTIKSTDGKTSETDTIVFVSVKVVGAGWSHDEGTFKYGDYISWSVASGWETLGLDTSTGKYVYYVTLEANKALEAKDLIANEGLITVSDKLTKEVIKTLPADLSIDIQAALVQANGFETVQAAWDSIKN